MEFSLSVLSVFLGPEKMIGRLVKLSVAGLGVKV
jgi:hypothetical protein